MLIVVAQGVTPMVPTNAETIAIINRPLMEDAAWRYVYGSKIEQRLRDVINWTAVLATFFNGQVPTMRLVEAVEAALDSTRPTARKYIEVAYERRLVSRQPDYDDERRTNYFLSAQQIRMRNDVSDLINAIDDVLAAQVAEPTNPVAGADRLPAEVYQNVVSKLSNMREAA